MKIKISILACAVLLAACTRPTEVIIPTDTSKWDTELAPTVKKLSEEDRKLLTGYLMRAKLSETFSKGAGGIPLGTTIGQAIEEQKKWAAEQEALAAAQRAKEAEEKALRAKLEKEAEAAREAITNAVTVTLVSKMERPSNIYAGQYRDRQVFIVGVENKTDEAMAGVSGELEFVDLFGKVVGAVNFRIAEKIAPKGTVKWTGERDYNQFLDNHRAVWNLERGQYTTRFIPDTIVFADGRKLSAKLPE